MKKFVLSLLVLALVAAPLTAPATAGKAKKVTLFLHGTHQAGEAELPTTWLDDAWMTMDATKPSGQPKSMFVTNYVGGPNTNCSGNGLLPLWKAEMKGAVKGTVTLHLHTVATPGATLVAALYPDANGECNEAAMPPAATTEVAVAPGHAMTEVKFENVNFKVLASLALQLHMAGPSPAQVRILYDGAGFESGMEFVAK